jgi:ribosome-binding protein aMBF1 (putative translation factor)
MSQSYAGKNLKHLRKMKGMTQEEFANKLQIKRSLLGAYEEERLENPDRRGHGEDNDELRNQFSKQGHHR